MSSHGYKSEQVGSPREFRRADVDKRWVNVEDRNQEPHEIPGEQRETPDGSPEAAADSKPLDP